MFVYSALFLSLLIEVKMSISHFNLVEPDESRKKCSIFSPYSRNHLVSMEMRSNRVRTESLKSTFDSKNKLTQQYDFHETEKRTEKKTASMI